MKKLKNFFNKISNNNRIFSREDIGEMSKDEFAREEKAIDYQVSQIGAPPNNALSSDENVVYVQEHTKNDGTKVKAHYRSKFGGSPTGAATSIRGNTYGSNNSLLNKAEIKINNSMNKSYPNAKEMANMYLVKPKNAPKSNDYNFITPGYSKNLNEKYNLTGNKNIPENWPGFAFNKNSSLSQNVSKSQQMQTDIRKQYDVSNGKFLKDKLDVNFTQDPNLHRSLGHATILEPHIDDEGYFNGYLYDKYDFDISNAGYYDDNYTLTAANNYFALRGLSKDRNYYVLTPVRFKW